MAMTYTKMLRICLVDMISTTDDTVIAFYHSNQVALTEFLQRCIDEARRRLREANLEHLTVDGEGKPIDQMHRVMSIVINAPKMLEDLKEDAPPMANKAKLEYWKAKWKEETSKKKRALDADAPLLLSKMQRSAQDTVGGHATSSVAGTERMMRTLHNHQCAHLVVIPSIAVKYIKSIGAGSFGTCSQVTIDGISFFPSTTIYAAKTYKGGTQAKLESFCTEKNMQKLNPSLVRCIACTGEPPWTTIFPFFNGTTIHHMLIWLPFRMSPYRRMAERLANVGPNFKPMPDLKPQSHELVRIKGFLENMPHICHAIINGMNDAHKSSFVHCDLHTRNLCLDFTRSGVCRVGIIDWGLMLLDGQGRNGLGYDEKNNSQPSAQKKIVREEAERKRQARPWMAPELYDPYCRHAFSKASDIYALGYLFMSMIHFWRKAHSHFFATDSEELPDHRRVYLLEDIVKRRMYIGDIDQRMSLSEVEDWMVQHLATEPGKAQRPLVEMIPNFL